LFMIANSQPNSWNCENASPHCGLSQYMNARWKTIHHKDKQSHIQTLWPYVSLSSLNPLVHGWSKHRLFSFCNISFGHRDCVFVNSFNPLSVLTCKVTVDNWYVAGAHATLVTRWTELAPDHVYWQASVLEAFKLQVLTPDNQ
jgi:hypothetical protein